MQLIKQQRVFLVTAWLRSKSYQVVSQEFSENFSDRNKKYREEGTKKM